MIPFITIVLVLLVILGVVLWHGSREIDREYYNLAEYARTYPEVKQLIYKYMCGSVDHKMYWTSGKITNYQYHKITKLATEIQARQPTIEITPEMRKNHLVSTMQSIGVRNED